MEIFSVRAVGEIPALLLVIGLGLGSPLASLAADPIPDDPGWPQWRGPSRDGRIGGPTWPADLGPERLKLLWRIDLGPSYSGPIVGKDRVFITETRDRETEFVRALDRSSGKELWRASWKGSISVPFFAKSNGDWIRATPAWDGEALYVAGMRDVLVRLSAETGEERWRVDFVDRLKAPLPAFGFVSSPLVDGEDLYVQAGASVVKLRKGDGSILWRALEDGGGMWGSAFSSPWIGILAGERQLVVQSRTKLAGLRPTDGKVLWSQEVEAFRGMNILTPTVDGDSIFTSAYGGKSRLFQIGRSGEDLRCREVWSQKAQGYMCTPVLLDGHAYLHLRSQRFTCIDLKTGEARWTSPEPFGKYWSLVLQGDRILALDERGTLYLLKATPEKFELLDSRKVGEETWAHLAVSGRQIFIRGLGALTAYAWK